MDRRQLACDKRPGCLLGLETLEWPTPCKPGRGLRAAHKPPLLLPPPNGCSLLGTSRPRKSRAWHASGLVRPHIALERGRHHTPNTAPRLCAAAAGPRVWRAGRRPRCTVMGMPPFRDDTPRQQSTRVPPRQQSTRVQRTSAPWGTGGCDCEELARPLLTYAAAGEADKSSVRFRRPHSVVDAPTRLRRCTSWRSFRSSYCPSPAPPHCPP